MQNWLFCTFQTSVTWIMHHSSTSTYIPNFVQITKTFCGWTEGCWDRLY